MKSHNTYPINEEQLKQSLQGYEVEYCEKQWEILEVEIANIKAKKNQVFKNFSAKLLVVPAAAVVLIVVLYFSLNNLISKNTNENIQPVTNTVQETIQHEPIPEPLPQTPKKAVDNSAVIAAEKAKLTADSISAESKKNLESNIKVVAVDSNSTTEKKSVDTSKIVSEPALNDQKTDVLKKKKKRKKKKNSFESIESLRKNSLVPNDEDNDVVVPN